MLTSPRRDLSRSTAAWLVSRPRAVTAILLLVLAGSAAALPRLRFATGFEPFVDREAPERAVLEAVNRHFVNADLVFIAYETASVFSHTALAEIRALGEGLMEITLPGLDDTPLSEVTSLATVEDVVGGDLELRTVRLVPEEIPTDPARLAEIERRARNNPIIADTLLSPRSSSVAAMVLRLAPSLTDAHSAELVRRIRVLLAEREASTGIRFHLTGAPAVAAETTRYMAEDLGTFIPVVYVLVGLMLLLFLRRLAGVLLALVNVTASLMVGMGTLSLLGGSVNNVSTMLPPIMLVLSVAVVIHFLSEVAQEARCAGEAAAVERALAQLLAPAFMVELTTAVGFAALAVSTVPAMRDFGVAAAIAVLLAFAISFFVVVLALRWRPASTFIALDDVPLAAAFGRALERYARLVLARPRAFLAAGLLSFAAAASGVPRIVVDTNELEMFREGSAIRRDTEFVEQHLGGTSVMVLSIKAAREGAFLEPELLRRLEGLDAFLRGELGADSVISLSDFVKLSHRAFDAEAPGSYRIPGSREQVAQLLMQNGDDTIRDYVDSTHQWARVLVRTRQHSSSALAAMYARLDDYIQKTFPAAEGYTAAATGEARLWAVMTEGIVGSQTDSLGLAFLLIFGPIFILFRSVRLGLYTIPSNLYPIGVTLGAMGWLGIRLDVSTAMIAPIVLGIAVDDTIHFVQHFRSRFDAHGDVRRAVGETFGTKAVGALWIMAIITAGFSVVTLSHFAPTRNFGLLTAIAMVSGIIGELLVLPPLVLVTHGLLRGRRASEVPELPVESAVAP